MPSKGWASLKIKAGRNASTALSAVWKTIRAEGSKDRPARYTAFDTGDEYRMTDR
jgi:hypothetical protein